ncbi:hypothetical protein ACMZZG_11490, partial [Pseudocitrobacter faecalis]|uniref:hypothetical protein n=1 Tax=Pseudocitrobacter faecalis TaxID=1398493 RepID=UPI0039EE45FF
NKAEGHPEGWPFCAGAKKKVPDAALPYPACKRTTLPNGTALQPVSSAPPGNTARTTPLWHSLNDTCPDTTSKDKNASRGLQR